MNRLSIILLFITFLFVACDNTSTQAKEQENAATAPGPVVRADAYLPSITMPELQQLWKNCNQMDYIFYELPISSSVNDNASAQSHLRHISDTPAGMKEKDLCGKAIGRIFYKSDGEDLTSAEVYFAGGCAFYVFYKDGKKTYSNLMTPEGVNHFNQIIATATQGPPKQ